MSTAYSNRTINLHKDMFVGTCLRYLFKVIIIDFNLRVCSLQLYQLGFIQKVRYHIYSWHYRTRANKKQAPYIKKSVHSK